MAKEDFYELRAEPDKNRIYITLKGFWSTRKKDEYKDYVKDLVNEVKKLEGNKFRALVDIRTFAAPPMEVGEMHVEAQKTLKSMGLIGAAEVYETFTAAQLATDRYAKESKLTRKAFTSIAEAEKWLDSLG